MGKNCVQGVNRLRIKLSKTFVYTQQRIVGLYILCTKVSYTHFFTLVLPSQKNLLDLYIGGSFPTVSTAPTKTSP